ncbi:MGA_1079 family surface serine endopeptidase [Mycoplasmopsis sturni]|uniref:MGA_1079 family surface serine endopeptidase n=1 Tax=Mycoplasmopsis sturni TaxID=39047 RepID=UPI0005621ADD|nr:hypothetical protein [Mycoplasmopsis sturni]
MQRKTKKMLKLSLVLSNLSLPIIGVACSTNKQEKQNDSQVNPNNEMLQKLIDFKNRNFEQILNSSWYQEQDNKNEFDLLAKQTEDILNNKDKIDNQEITQVLETLEAILEKIKKQLQIEQANQSYLDFIRTLIYLSPFQKEYFVNQVLKKPSLNDFKSLQNDAADLNIKMEAISKLLEASVNIQSNTNIKYYFASADKKKDYDQALSNLSNSTNNDSNNLAIDKLQLLISNYNNAYQNLDGEQNANLEQYRQNVIKNWNSFNYFINEEKELYSNNFFKKATSISQLEKQNAIANDLNSLYKKINTIFNDQEKLLFKNKLIELLKNSNEKEIQSLEQKILDYLAIEQKAKAFYVQNNETIKNSKWIEREDQNKNVSNALEVLKSFSSNEKYNFNNIESIEDALLLLEKQLPVIVQYQKDYDFINGLTSLTQSQKEHYFNLIKIQTNANANREKATSLNTEMAKLADLMQQEETERFKAKYKKAKEEQKTAYNSSKTDLQNILNGTKQDVNDAQTLNNLIQKFIEARDDINSATAEELRIETLKQPNLTRYQKLLFIEKINKSNTKALNELEQEIYSVNNTTSLLKTQFEMQSQYWENQKFIDASSESQEKFVKVYQKAGVVFLNTQDTQIINDQYLKNLLEEYKNSYQNLLPFESSSDLTTKFKQGVELEVNPRIWKYDLNLTPLSFSKDNFSLFTVQNNVEGITPSLVDFGLKPKKYTDLEVNYEIKDQNNHKEKATVKISLPKNEYDVEAILDSIQYTKISDLYDFDDSIFYKLSVDDFQDPSKIKKFFTKKFNKVGRFFDYDINLNKIQITGSGIDRVVHFEVLISHKNQVFKVLDLTHNYTLIGSVDKPIFFPTEKFKASEYYSNTFENNKLLVDYIQELFDAETKKYGIFDNSKWYDNSSTKVSTTKRTEILTKIYQDNFILGFDSYDRFEAKPTSNFKNPFASFNEKTNELKIGVKFLTNEIEKTESTQEISIRPGDFSSWVQDAIDFEKIYSLIHEENNKKLQIENILVLTKIKEGVDKPHNYYIASEGKSKLNDIYDFAKIGRYSLKVDYEASQNLKISEVDSWVEVKFRIYKDNQPLNDSKYLSPIFKFENFKTFSQWDIKPKNGQSYTDDDFVSSINTPEASSDQELISRINARNFKPKRVFGVSWLSGERIVEQDAYNKMIYLLDILPTQFKDQSSTSSEAEKLVDAKDIIYYSRTEKYNDSNIKKIIDNYYFYFIKDTSYKGSVDGRLLPVKIGFINKKNHDIRFLSKRIIFYNLISEYDKELAPFVLLNNLTPSDFQFNPAILNNSINDFITKVSNNTLGDNQIIISNSNAFKTYLFEPTRNTYEQKDIASTLKIADVKMQNYQDHTIYVRLKWDLNGRTYESSTWYKLKLNDIYNQNDNFRRSDDPKNILKILKVNTLKYGKDLLDKSGDVEGDAITPNHLTKIFLDNNTVLRERDIEIDWMDSVWTLDKEKNIASWVFKKKYFDALFNRDNLTNPTIQFHLNGNVVVIDRMRAKRIFNENQGINLEIDYDKLKKDRQITFDLTTEKVDNTDGSYVPFNYQIVASLREEGILFEVKMKDDQYKIVLGNIKDNLYIYPIADDVPANRQIGQYGRFYKERAFYVDRFGSNIKISYQNNIENEKFGSDTNKIAYDKLVYSAHDYYGNPRYPFVLYSKDFETEPFGYNPNQNLLYKLHDGYKFNVSYLLNAYDNNKLIEELKSKSIAYTLGSATILGKVSDDPSDGKFYVITNHHVQNNNKTESDLIGTINDGTTVSIVYNGYDHDRRNRDAIAPSWPIWSGTNQYSNPKNQDLTRKLDEQNSYSEKRKGLIFKTGKWVDLTISIIDVNSLIEDAKRKNKFGLSLDYAKWFKLEPTKFNTIFSDYSPILYGKGYNSEVLGNDINTFNGSFNALFNGWPYHNENGYLVTRASIGQENISYKRQTKFVPTFFAGGNSGTGVQGPGGYYSTINSGYPLRGLVSWDYLNPDYNYLGLTTEKAPQFLDANERSFAAAVLKLNAYDPSSYNLPWYWDLKKNN